MHIIKLKILFPNQWRENFWNLPAQILKLNFLQKYFKSKWTVQATETELSCIKEDGPKDLRGQSTKVDGPKIKKDRPLKGPST